MIIIRGLHNLPDIKSPLFITIGNFDGLHLGHKKIIQSMKQKAREKHAHTMVLSFFPHPLRVLNPSAQLGLLSTFRDKVRALAKLEIDFLLFIRFTKQFSGLRAEDFIKEILHKRLHIKKIFLGGYHTFGFNNRGSTALLHKSGEHYDFTVHKVDEVFVHGQRVSSSLIRTCLEEGRIKEANDYLGRPYSLSGRVVHGSGRGKKLGYPTANLAISNQLLPAAGVYVTKISFNKQIFEGLVNIGCRPTFKENNTDTEKKTILEIYIFNFEGNIYRQKISIEILERLRPEIAFNSSSDLIQQIKIDISKAQQWMREKK
ncbi:MAG: bifunctional riboflavin kinase/FAD synthetase [bacterium]